MKNPIKWAPLLQRIYNGENVKCPYCGGDISYRFFAENKIGFAQFQCSDCGEEGHLSRVAFPEKVETEKLYIE